jgi:hypothetical protein
VLLKSLIEAGLLTAGALVLAVAAFLLGGPHLAYIDLRQRCSRVGAWPFLVAIVVTVTVRRRVSAFVLSRVRPAGALRRPT